MSEHSIITFHACSKPGAKYPSFEDEEEELASSLREDCHTLLVRHQYVDVAAVELQGVPKKMGGGSLEGGHLLTVPGWPCTAQHLG